MVVDSPEVFDSAKGSDKTKIVFPLVALFIFEKPERPCVLKRMFDFFSGGSGGFFVKLDVAHLRLQHDTEIRRISESIKI